jgi:hypothetical protein
MWRQLQQALTQTRTMELHLDWLRDDARFIARLGAAKNPRVITDRDVPPPSSATFADPLRFLRMKCD